MIVSLRPVNVLGLWGRSNYKRRVSGNGGRALHADTGGGKGLALVFMGNVQDRRVVSGKKKSKDQMRVKRFE